MAGHDIMALERFDPDTRHMIVFDVLSHESPMGYKGEQNETVPDRSRVRQGLENQDKGFIKIKNHAKVIAGNLRYDQKTVSCRGIPKTLSKRVENPLFFPL